MTHKKSRLTNRYVPAGNKDRKKRMIFTYSIVTLVLLIITLVVIVFNTSQDDISPELSYERDIARHLGLDFKKQGELFFVSASGDTLITIDIELAEDEVRRQIGMMFREEMADRQGMLFIFPEEEIRSFWMRNTLISLDMIFVNTALEIVTIQKNTVPLTENSYFSSKPAKYVIEVKAGFADKYSIKTGDKIFWKRHDG